MNYSGFTISYVIDVVTKLIAISGALWTLILYLTGILPVWYKLAVGIAKGKIAIFSLNGFTSLKSMLIDSKVFKEKNIIQVHYDDMKKADKAKVFLVHWKDFQEKMSEILQMKADSTALVVYAPQDEGRIDEATLQKINSERNAIVVNFRGRLMNDILTSLITTSYAKQ